jgi:uncharacterized protein with von Willebrand factor type A (vWA) domain
MLPLLFMALPLDVSITQRPVGRPHIVLVLDYSGSMAGIRLQRMREGVAALVRARPDVDWAAVAFSDAILRRVRFGEHAAAEIEDLLQTTQPVSGTDTAMALEKARALLATPTTQVQGVVLISDGAPNDAARAREEAQKLRQLAPLATLAVGDDPSVRSFMTGLAGDPALAAYVWERARIDAPLAALVDRLLHHR